MKIRIRSEVVVEHVEEITPEEFRRAYHEDFGECDRWLGGKQEAKIRDKLTKYANGGMKMRTTVTVEEKHEHSED